MSDKEKFLKGNRFIIHINGASGRYSYVSDCLVGYSGGYLANVSIRKNSVLMWWYFMNKKFSVTVRYNDLIFIEND